MYIRYDGEKGRVVVGPLEEEAFKEVKESVRRRIEAYGEGWGRRSFKVLGGVGVKVKDRGVGLRVSCLVIVATLASARESRRRLNTI